MRAGLRHLRVVRGYGERSAGGLDEERRDVGRDEDDRDALGPDEEVLIGPKMPRQPAEKDVVRRYERAGLTSVH